MTPNKYDAVLTSPGDVASALPSLLGYQPHHALAAVFLSGKAIACTLAVTLPADLVTAHPAAGRDRRTGRRGQRPARRLHPPRSRGPAETRRDHPAGLGAG